MFVKLFREKDESEIILNIDEISSITKLIVNYKGNKDFEYTVKMTNGTSLEIYQEEYIQICKILMRRV